jgi:hypothetical protein
MVETIEAQAMHQATQAEKQSKRPDVSSADLSQNQDKKNNWLQRLKGLFKRGKPTGEQTHQALTELANDTSSAESTQKVTESDQKPVEEAQVDEPAKKDAEAPKTQEQIREEKLQKLSDRTTEVMQKLKDLPSDERGRADRSAMMLQLMNEMQENQDVFGKNLAIVESEDGDPTKRTLVLRNPVQKTLTEPVFIDEDIQQSGRLDRQTTQIGTETTVRDEYILMHQGGIGEFATIVSQKVAYDSQSEFFKKHGELQRIDMQDQADRHSTNAEYYGQQGRDSLSRILDAGTFSPKVDFPDSDSKDPYVQQRIQGERQLLTGLGALLQPDRAFGKSETFQTEGGRKIGKYDSDSGYKHVFDVWTGGGGVSVGVENPQIVESAFKSNAVK